MHTIMDRDRSYFERRLVEERVAAANALDPFVGLAHLAFVRLYKERLAESAPSPQSPSMPLHDGEAGAPRGFIANALYRQFIR